MKTKTKTRNALCGLLSGLLLLAAGNSVAQVTNPVYPIHTYRAENNFLDSTAIPLANGSPVGAVGFTAGQVGSAFNFTGSSYITLGTAGSLSGARDFAVSAWIRTSFGTPQTIIQQRDEPFGLGQYTLKIGTSHNTPMNPGRVYFMVAGTGSSYLQEVWSNRRVDDGQWHLIRAERQGARVRILIDGVVDVSATFDSAVVLGPPVSPTYIGADRRNIHYGFLGLNPGYFRGQIDQVAIETNFPPIANAGADFSVNEGQTGVALNGSLSSDPDPDPLTYSWVQLPGGPAVTLTGANTAGPTFTAPTVALGGETLTFELTVTSIGESSVDTVSVTVVNVNHPPVAEAGPDQSIAEGSPVTLDGSASFDIDTDPFTYAWVQVGGTPTVTLTGANTANPTFTAPYVGANGAPGVVATLVFELRVDDGFLPAATDAPAPGYALTNVVDRVTVEITNTNNDPIAAAGADQTVNENSPVALSAATSSDPDSDTLTYAWTKISGPTVTLTGAATATPSFTAPFVGAGGADLEFEVTVDDGYGGSDTDRVVIHVQNINDPPLASAAQPTVASLWPPNHQMVAVGITGVTDPNNNATITITGVTQDEPTNGLGDGDTAIDAVINGDGTVLLRSERSGKGDGRVYRISFTASDLEGSTSGVVLVKVPHSVKKPAIDSLSVFNSTN